METQTMTELRTGLAEVLTRVQMTGKPVLITSHGRPIAVISPVQSGWTITDAKGDQ